LNQADLARVQVMVWAIWWTRQNAIHDNEFQNPMSTLCFVNKYLDELEVASMAASSSTKVSSSRPREKKKWFPPEAGQNQC
jgi:hypothetical protein